MAKRPRLQSGFTLGGEQAEADPLLEEAFIESSDYRVMAAKDDPRCYVIGRTGSGKSAALQAIEERSATHVVRINPEDLSLPYITDLHVIRYLDSLDVNLDLFWIALWKHVLLVEIIRHRYTVDSQDAKQRFLQNLRQKISRDSAKKAALDYLDEFEGKFWCETDERVREITDKFTERIDTGGEVGGSALGLKAGAKATSSVEDSSETKTQQAERYQRIVNETQLSKINKMIAVLDEDILDPQHFTYILMDDLDRDWIDERLANDLIRCLFRTVLDLKRVKNLKVLVALRTNIFQELDFGRRSGGQEEKFRSLVLQVQWTRHDLQHLLDERVRLAAPKIGLEATSMQELLPHSNRTRGNPIEYLFDRTLLRPRDAIAFANECLRVGVGKTRLSWDDLRQAEAEYSAKRLLALRDEWKGTYPGIDSVLAVFRGSPSRLDKADLQARLEEIMLLLSDPSFPGVRWLTDASEAMWSAGGAETWFEVYQPLLRILFNVGVLGMAIRPSAAPVFSLDDPLVVESQTSVDKVQHFFIHRTYHLALDVRTSRDGQQPAGAFT